MKHLRLPGMLSYILTEEAIKTQSILISASRAHLSASMPSIRNLPDLTPSFKAVKAPG